MKSSIANAYRMISGFISRGTTMKEVMALFGLALVFFAIAYFIGLPTVWDFFEYSSSSC